MWRYSAGSYIATSVLILPNMIMPVIIAQRKGPTSAAYFYIASLLATSLTFVPQATSRSFFAEAAHDPDRLGAICIRATRLTILGQTPLLITLLVGGKLALGLFGSKYQQAYPLLVLLVITNALTSVAFLGSTLLLLTSRIKLLCCISVASSVVALGGTILFLSLIHI